MHQSSPRKKLGVEGERAVSMWLQDHGYLICACNYRNSYGEIDIIAQKDDVVAFVEVKSRSQEHFDLSEVVNVSKQRKIIKTAHSYIAKRGTVTFTYRFDVALVKRESDGFKITYIEDAFNTEND